MRLTRQSPGKINLLLNILGRRPDGFHELETVFLPIALQDELEFDTEVEGIRLDCNHPEMPLDGTNLVVRAAAAFFEATGLPPRVGIRLEKRLPLAAGLGGGSGNGACTLLALNELHGFPLPRTQVTRLAAGLGSDVPFFLEGKPALAFGRGERLELTPPLVGLAGLHLVLLHPGFGVSTAWAYRRLAAFPEALNGRPGRAARMVHELAGGRREAGLAECFNSLETPAFEKFPILRLHQEVLRREGALATLMSGSGSTTFGLFADAAGAERAREGLLREFGPRCWTAQCAVEISEG